MAKNGYFVLSLDFELMWGIRDVLTKEQYGKNIEAVWEVIPQLIQAFETHEVKGTFATVGLLFAENKSQLEAFSPERTPQYTDANLSPYNGHFEQVGVSATDDRFHFALPLIEELKKYPNQEIGSHTFSHYYCIEPGQTVETFKADIQAAKAIAAQHGVDIKSLVFPRNQFNEEYLKVCLDEGIIAYRGNESAWFYQAESGGQGSLLKRGSRLADSYLNVSGPNIYNLDHLAQKQPFNIPASRFLRPYSPKLKRLEKIRLRRILNAMTAAAQQNKLYHLWWHPHNFGNYQTENFAFLNHILTHYQKLNQQYQFESITMTGLAQKLANNAY